jgi:hypothetical protein
MKEIETKKGYVLVDDHVYEYISQWRWQIGKNGYACRDFYERGKRKTVNLHRLIWEKFVGTISDGLYVDHINRDRLDNTLDNLRLVTPHQNSLNSSKQSNNLSSKYKGVTKNKQTGNWVAYITKHKKRNCIGSFTNEEAAANAYNYHAEKEFGDFSSLNEVEIVMSYSEWNKFMLPKRGLNNYSGISFRKDNGKWRVLLYDLQKNKINVGHYNSEREALIARNNYVTNHLELADKYPIEEYE